MALFLRIPKTARIHITIRNHINNGFLALLCAGAGAGTPEKKNIWEETLPDSINSSINSQSKDAHLDGHDSADNTDIATNAGTDTARSDTIGSTNDTNIAGYSSVINPEEAASENVYGESLLRKTIHSFMRRIDTGSAVTRPSSDYSVDAVDGTAIDAFLAGRTLYSDSAAILGPAISSGNIRQTASMENDGLSV